MDECSPRPSCEIVYPEATFEMFEAQASSILDPCFIPLSSDILVAFATPRSFSFLTNPNPRRYAAAEVLGDVDQGRDLLVKNMRIYYGKA
jgi:hypothetical protein